jgi:flavodoxin
MKACVLYFSLTGNTKRFAEAISKSLNIPIFDMAISDPLIVNDYELIILGTPVHGLSPAKPVLNFIEKLPKANEKQAIIFTTYAIRKGKANKKLRKNLEDLGYKTILSLSKRGFKLGEKDFSKSIIEITQTINL